MSEEEEWSTPQSSSLEEASIELGIEPISEPEVGSKLTEVNQVATRLLLGGFFSVVGFSKSTKLLLIGLILYWVTTWCTTLDVRTAIFGRIRPSKSLPTGYWPYPHSCSAEASRERRSIKQTGGRSRKSSKVSHVILGQVTFPLVWDTDPRFQTELDLN